MNILVPPVTNHSQVREGMGEKEGKTDIKPEHNPVLIRRSPVLHHHKEDVRSNIIAGKSSSIGLCGEMPRVDL